MKSLIAYRNTLERGQKLHHRFEPTGQLLARHPFAVQIQDADHKVVAMQVDSCHQLRHWSPFGFEFCCSFILLNERPLFYREATAADNH